MTKILQSCRQGFSLLEVLVSVFVVLIGLLGVATMIPAGRYEILQARNADMGADLSRAAMNCVITQISNGWQPGANNFFIIANGSTEFYTRLSQGLGAQGLGLTACPQTVNNNRIFNGDDDPIIIEGDNNQLNVVLENGATLGTGVYTACATVVSLDNGYYEVTGLAVYRYNKDLDSNDYKFKRGSYAFFADNTGKQRWYKIENVYTNARGQATISTAAGERTSTNAKYLGDVVGICKKVVRIDDSYSTN